MGGCKCVYRSCKMSSDGVTHFFHFPVKDPKRLKKWIANSDRYDFLQLSMTQIKNKVICERHFEQSMFMNYKRDRLVHDAVPTKESPSANPDTSVTVLEDVVTVPILPDTVDISDIVSFSMSPTACPQAVESKSNIPLVKINVVPANNAAVDGGHVSPTPKSFGPVYSKMSPSVLPLTRLEKGNLKRKSGIPLSKPAKGDRSIPELALKLVQNIAKRSTPKRVEEFQPKYFPDGREVLLVNRPEEAGVESGKTETDDLLMVPLYDVDAEQTRHEAAAAATTELSVLINTASQMIAELKELTEKRERKREEDVVQRAFRPLSKTAIYAQIVPHLSTELSKMVHKEMFPSMSHIHKS